MINIKKGDGFTLVELLIGMNLAFIAITIIVSLYLFVANYSISLSKKMYEKEIIMGTLDRLEEMLKKCDHYEIIGREELSIHIVIDSEDSVLINSKSFIISNSIKLEDIQGYSLRLMLDSGEILIADSIKGTSKLQKYGPISSSSINTIKLDIFRNEAKYSMSFIKPKTSINYFKDITE